MKKLYNIYLFLLILSFSNINAKDIPIWPIDQKGLFENLPEEDFLQPTSDDINSAKFGCVRNGGYRFHEGVDIKCVKRDSRNCPKDKILAFLDGKIVHINKIGGNSSYGKYVVIEHVNLDVPIYSLYSHLNSIDKSLHIGKNVKQGEVLGIMGNTAGGYRISNYNAHLHFETGLRYSDKFDSWYKNKGIYGSKNHHNNFNGMNLCGFDPYELLQKVKDGKYTNMIEHINSIDTAFVLDISTNKIPFMVRKYPKLLQGEIPKDLVGWIVEFAWFGMPKKFTAISAKDSNETRYNLDIKLISYNPEVLKNKRRGTIDLDKNQNPKKGKYLSDIITKIMQ